MANAKNVSYTEEQTTSLLAQFAEGVTVEALASAFGKSTRSIIAKLSREGVYKAKERVSKTGEPIKSKEEFVEDIAALLGCSADDLTGLEKANKTTLARVFKGLGG